MPVTSGPRSQYPVPAAKRSPGPVKAPVEDQIRVLIADDHPVVREGLRAMLEIGGMNVVGDAASGREAIDLARETRPDVVLMDIRMPGIDGLAATRLIKQQKPDMAVIMLTSYDSRDYLRRSLEAGASSYILKGMTADTLVQTIRAVKSGTAVVDTGIIAGLTAAARPPAGRTGSAPLLETLAPHERRVLRLLMRGLSNNQIVDETGYTLGTVKNVVHRIIVKLGVSNRTQAAIAAARVWTDAG